MKKRIARRELRPGKLSVFAALAAMMLAVPLAPRATSHPKRESLIVSAAVSLTGSLQSIKSIYGQLHPNVSIALNLGASGILQQQIEEGAPADIFISASPREMNALEERGLLLGATRRNLLTNTLVLITPPGRDGIASFRDLLRPEVKRLAMANPESVPAGLYARQTLEYFKIYRQLQPKIIRAGDVRQALAYVETGDADAGIVYLTEARLSSKVRVAAEAPASSHDAIVYPVAVIERSRHAAAAEEFVRFLETPEAKKIFEREGFQPFSR
ncbi:MAG: molybdate ABC transporter substrate-binding protein [Acidobacteriota bacterium]|nr:molybdate ABC transporter substrate-binding protein [Acidobacteriota bacterium]